MATIKVAGWNIYFSHNLIEKDGAGWKIKHSQKKRTENVAKIIKDMDADLLGIVECMPEDKLKFFLDHFNLDYDIIMEGDAQKLNIGLLYRKNKVEVKKINVSSGSWKDRIGYGGKLLTYRFSRVPLVAEVKYKANGRFFLLATIHTKSKKTYTSDPTEPLKNRRKIIAQCLRMRSILSDLVQNNAVYQRFMVMGDINDGPGFDQYEAKIATSGVETLAGNVFKPDDIYYTFVDLSTGGIPTTPFEGAPQLDHILYSRQMKKYNGARVRPGTGRVRSDLVDFSTGSGKRKDSDHIPVEIKIGL